MLKVVVLPELLNVLNVLLHSMLRVGGSAGSMFNVVILCCQFLGHGFDSASGFVMGCESEERFPHRSLDVQL